MKKAGKQTPTPKSEQFKKVFAKEELSSDEIDSMSSNSFDEDFEVGLCLNSFHSTIHMLL